MFNESTTEIRQNVSWESVMLRFLSISKTTSVTSGYLVNGNLLPSDLHLEFAILFLLFVILSEMLSKEKGKFFVWEQL